MTGKEGRVSSPECSSAEAAAVPWSGWSPVSHRPGTFRQLHNTPIEEM